MLSLVMALTVFSIPTGAFADDEQGNEEPGYYLHYINAEGDAVYSDDVTVDFSQLEKDCWIYINKRNEGYWDWDQASKLVWHNPYSDSAVVKINYYDENEGYCLETTDKEVEITGSDQSIQLIPLKAGTAKLSVDVYDGDNVVATLNLTVNISQEEYENYCSPEYIGSIAIGGEPFVWQTSDNEDDYSRCISIDPLSSDIVARLSVVSDAYASASLYEVANDEEDMAYAYVNDDGDSNSDAVALKAGKKYYISLYRDNVAAEVKVTLEPNPIQEIRYHSDKVLYENTGGWWEPEYKTGDNGEDILTGNRYYQYDYGWNEGDTLTFVDNKGNLDVYTCKSTEEMDGYDYSTAFINENGTLIGREDIEIYASSAQREKHWTVGSDNAFEIEYQGLKAEIKVTIEESPVAKLTVTSAGQYTVAEDGYEIEEGLNGEDYYRYVLPYWNEGDKITIEYKDGTTKTYVFSYKEGEDVWTLEGGTEVLDAEELYIDSDQETKNWDRTVGSINTFYAVFMGKKSNDLKAKILPSIGKAKVTLRATSLVYTGKARKPAVKTMKYGNSILKYGTHYTLDYCEKAIGVGKYYIGYRGIGSYGGFKETTFKVIPKGAKILKPKAAKKAITVKWKKQGTKMKYQNVNYDTKSAHITGYQIQYGLKSSFKGAKTKKVKGYKKTALKIGKLKGKKKYYVRVRTYMKIKGVGTFYSKWSAKKAVTTKK